MKIRGFLRLLFLLTLLAFGNRTIAADVVVMALGLSSQLEGEEMTVREPGFLGGDTRWETFRSNDRMRAESSQHH